MELGEKPPAPTPLRGLCKPGLAAGSVNMGRAPETEAGCREVASHHPGATASHPPSLATALHAGQRASDPQNIGSIRLQQGVGDSLVLGARAGLPASCSASSGMGRGERATPPVPGPWCPPPPSAGSQRLPGDSQQLDRPGGHELRLRFISRQQTRQPKSLGGQASCLRPARLCFFENTLVSRGRREPMALCPAAAQVAAGRPPQNFSTFRPAWLNGTSAKEKGAGPQKHERGEGWMGKPAMRRPNKPLLMATQLAECQLWSSVQPVISMQVGAQGRAPAGAPVTGPARQVLL